MEFDLSLPTRAPPDRTAPSEKVRAMRRIDVTRTIDAPIAAVFEAYIDHERLSDLPMVRSVTIAVPGRDEKNGLGAVRVVDSGLVLLREEITAFERPNLMECRIRESRPKTEHELGRVEFAQHGDRTKVTWTTVFGLHNPILALTEPIFAACFKAIFTLTLKQVEKRAVTASAHKP
ncbi:SRPBCC family protein [Gordonia soli]|uniref:Polyketide cyclase/dehydrase n=1 Tax=Gordonia soli NBRC 108243 TaxID=1223545 RepID=M0QJ03_9ACTN|nr:SRPBCC family protein [Gordonia soli]GAC67392.1 hypothetical protein GS4_07_01410 [Gordonia soli NBRC 108243]